MYIILSLNKYTKLYYYCWQFISNLYNMKTTHSYEYSIIYRCIIYHLLYNDLYMCDLYVCYTVNMNMCYLNMHA